MASDRTPLVYKRLPSFQPEHARAWIDDVKAAFAERNWSEHLIYPPLPPIRRESSTPSTLASELTEAQRVQLRADEQRQQETQQAFDLIDKQAVAFIKQGLDYQYRYGLEQYKTASELLHAIDVKYNSFTQEDEIRLEQTLMDLQKSKEKTIDSHIASFSTLLSRIMASDTSGKWSDGRQNASFLRTLTRAIDAEEAQSWKQFHAYVGTTLFSVSPDTVFAQARSWYETNVLPNITTLVISDSNANVLATRSSGYPPRNFNRDDDRNIYNPPSNPPSDPTSGRREDNGENYLLKSRDDTAWCSWHGSTGHWTRECVAQKRDPNYQRWLQQRNSRSNNSNDNPRRAATVRVFKTSIGLSSIWRYDTCATQHMTDQLEAVHRITMFDKPLSVYGVGNSDKRILNALGVGSVILSSTESGTHTQSFHDVLYVPDLGESIISKQCARKDGIRLGINDNETFVLSAPSGFSATTRTVDGMESLPSVTAIKIAQSYATQTNPIVAHMDTDISDESNCSNDDSEPQSGSQSESNPPKPTSERYANKDPSLWHQRLGHVSNQRVSTAIGIPMKQSNCEPCILGKMTSTPYHPVKTKSTAAIFRIYIDHCGPITPISFGGNKYVLTIRDEATGYTWVYLLPNKKAKSVISVLKLWIPNVERQSGNKLKIIRTDDAEEFKAVNEQFLQSLGIEHETTAGYASSSNGVVERAHRTLFDMARCMILNAGLPSQFWADAVKNACYLLNRLPTSSNPNNATPYELWFGQKPLYNHIRVFGCISYHRLPTKTIKESHKIDPRAVKCVLLGHIGNKMYKLFDLESQRVRKSRSVAFHENEFPVNSEFKIKIDNTPLSFGFEDYPDNEDIKDDNNTITVDNDGFIVVKRHNGAKPSIATPSSRPITTSNSFNALPDEDSDDEDDYAVINPPSTSTSTPASESSDTDQTPILSLIPTPAESPMPPHPSSPMVTQSAPTQTPTETPAESNSDSELPPEPIKHSSLGRQLIPSHKAKANTETARELEKERANARGRGTSRGGRGRGRGRRGNAAANAVSTIEPKSYYESQLTDDADKWHEAAYQEITSLDDLGVWEIVPRPTDRKVLNSKFVFKIKDKHTKNPRHKARLVARGFEEIKGLDYTDTFAPVVKPSSARTIISHAAANKRELRQFDVKNAYANSDTSMVSYIEFPKGFEDPRYPPEFFCLRVLKALYGRHASAMEWYNKVCTEVKKFEFIPCETDPCVFMNKERDIILAVYVDDFLVSASNKAASDWLLSKLNESFETRDLGPIKRFLGIDFHRPDPAGPIFMNQAVYIREILSDFGMENCNPVFTPLNPSTKLHKRKEDEEAADIEWYRRLIGKFMHLLYTRTDIGCAVSKLAQFLSDPSEIHAKEAKHLLRYLKGTTDLGIEYGANDNEFSHINGYCDASFDDDPDNSRSTTGQIFMYNGGSISHQSKKQPIVALSTMESELMAISEATREAMFLKSLFEELEILKQPTIPMLTDSQPAYDHITKNLNHRTKHIHRRFNFARDAHLDGEIELQRIPATEQAADILTKILSRVKHAEALKLLNMRSFTIPV